MKKQSGNLKICLVDDDQIYQFTAKKILESLNPNYRIQTFYNGLEAYDFFKSHSTDKTELPDILFLDINMPVIDGWGFLDAYKNINGDMVKSPTIFMVSSSVNEKDISKSKQNKLVSDYIIKPLHKKTMEELLNNITD